MATKKKRIAISCSEELYKSLARLAGASGAPMSAFPTQVLEGNVELFNRLADAMEVAQEDKSKGMGILGGILNKQLVDTAQLSINLNDVKG